MASATPLRSRPGGPGLPARGRRPLAVVIAGVAFAAAALTPAGGPPAAAQNLDFSPPDQIMQFAQPEPGPALVEAGALIRVGPARERNDVTGAGLTVAVLDSGLRTTHVDFGTRVVARRNFTNEGMGPEDVKDVLGHGTNVGGIIVANKDHVGIAPGANIIPLKVLFQFGGPTLDATDKALQWVLDNRETHKITVVNLSFGIRHRNHLDEAEMVLKDSDVCQKIRDKIKALRQKKVAVVAAAGNDYHEFSRKLAMMNKPASQGMCYPAVCRETISVGAVYDIDLDTEFTYDGGASVKRFRKDRICPFSQRLHESVSKDTYTDIFAPGAPIKSTGKENDHGESLQFGTSQAAPVVAGVVLLLQQYYLDKTGALPSVDNLERWLRLGGTVILDDPTDDDNVEHTQQVFKRLDAVGAFEVMRRELREKLFTEQKPLK